MSEELNGYELREYDALDLIRSFENDEFHNKLGATVIMTYSLHSEGYDNETSRIAYGAELHGLVQDEDEHWSADVTETIATIYDKKTLPQLYASHRDQEDEVLEVPITFTMAEALAEFQRKSVKLPIEPARISRRLGDICSLVVSRHFPSI